MIHEAGGRSRSQRTVAEVEEMLSREMANLDPSEKEALQLLLAELREGQANGGMYEALRTSEYKTQPVGMEQFVKDPYFLGNTCENIYPQLMDDLVELFSGGYHESVWTGSIGYGKTFAASIGVCRVLYEISCLRDPHATFSLAKDSNISVICLSVNEMLAVKVAFENIATKIKASPYFQKNFPFAPTKKELRFPNNIWVAARATTDSSALGLNAVAALLDETNFMPTKGKEAARMGYVDHAEVIYNSVQRRMKSRFQRKGKLPGMLFVVSSKKTSDDFTARRVRAAREDSTVFVRDYALWDVKPENFSAVKFQVLVGNEQTPSKILDPAEVDAFRAKPPEGSVVLDVPEDFRSDFESDLEGSIRDLAGCATVSISPFIQRREKIFEAVEQDKKLYGGNRHPFSTHNYDPSKGGSFLWEKMIRMQETRGLSGVSAVLNKPIINPAAHRHVHIDPALRNDALGFCMSHISGWRDVIRRSENQGQYMERAPVYVVDLILQVVPPAGDEIILGDIRRLIYELSAHGYAINFVSLDSFQSRDTLQQLQQKGYNAEMVSVDTSMEPYENLKTALYENRVYCYEYQPLIRELQQLEKDSLRRKVDHPPKGCFVGSTRIPLADGTIERIENLVDREVWVYASTAKGLAVPRKAKGRFTKRTSELVEVVQANGLVETCTPEHRWMLRDGSYREAQQLRPGIDRLRPLGRFCLEGGGCEIRAVTPIHLQEPVAVYDLEVEEWPNFALASGVFVHNSKDCSDALAGCLFTLFSRRIQAPLPMLRGLSVYGDAWLPEQRQAELAGDRTASMNKDLNDYGMLPPFLMGSNDGNGKF